MIPRKPRGIPRHFKDFTRLPRKWKKYMKKYGGHKLVGFNFDGFTGGSIYFDGVITYEYWHDRHCEQHMFLSIGQGCVSTTMSKDFDWALGKRLPKDGIEGQDQI